MTRNHPIDSLLRLGTSVAKHLECFRNSTVHHYLGKNSRAKSLSGIVTSR